jgi:hypothetical protein
MNEDQFAALNEHLKEVRPIMDDFCARHGFTYVDRRSLGRYPRIRIEKAGMTRIWFDLWMELDKGGRRVEQFSRDLPYELSAGAYVDVPGATKYGDRFQKAIQCFSGKPFYQVSAVLLSEMEKHLPTLQEWDLHYLSTYGRKVQLGA